MKGAAGCMAESPRRRAAGVQGKSYPGRHTDSKINSLQVCGSQFCACSEALLHNLVLLGFPSPIILK
jgi:hypothetical protein